MKNTSYCIIILLLILTFDVNAQNELWNKPFLEDYRFTRIVEGTVFGKNIKIADIQGIPYLNVKFEAGKITTSDGKVYGNIPLRYNAFTDDLEFSNGNINYNIEPKFLIKRAEFGGSVFSYMPYDYRGSVQNGFFKIFNGEKATLLVRFTIKFLDMEETKPYMDPKPARFSDVKKEYFLAIGGTPAKAVSNKKMLLQMFGEKAEIMEAFISKNKYSIKDEDCLRKIVEYYNGL